MNSKQLSRPELEDLIRKRDSSVTYVERKKLPSSSHLWEHFHQVFVHEVQQNFVSCNVCKSLLSYTSANGTKVMKTHLIACQKSILQTDVNHQKSIKEFYSPPATIKVPKHIKSSITTACAEFAAMDNRAFETISGEGFYSLAKQLVNAGRFLGNNSSSVDVQQLLPHSTTVIRFFIPSDYIEEIVSIYLGQFSCRSNLSAEKGTIGGALPIIGHV